MVPSQRTLLQVILFLLPYSNGSLQTDQTALILALQQLHRQQVILFLPPYSNGLLQTGRTALATALQQLHRQCSSLSVLKKLSQITNLSSRILTAFCHPIGIPIP